MSILLAAILLCSDTKVLARRPGQLCSEAENYSNLKSSSPRAILIVFPLPKILNTQSSRSSWEPILDFDANVCQAGQIANHWIGDEMQITIMNVIFL